jgi:hypothetical protein
MSFLRRWYYSGDHENHWPNPEFHCCIHTVCQLTLTEVNTRTVCTIHRIQCNIQFRKLICWVFPTNYEWIICPWFLRNMIWMNRLIHKIAGVRSVKLAYFLVKLMLSRYLKIRFWENSWKLQVYLTTILTVWTLQMLVGTIARKTLEVFFILFFLFFWSPALVDLSGSMSGSLTNTQTIFDICPRN